MYVSKIHANIICWYIQNLLYKNKRMKINNNFRVMKYCSLWLIMLYTHMWQL